MYPVQKEIEMARIKILFGKDQTCIWFVWCLFFVEGIFFFWYKNYTYVSITTTIHYYCCHYPTLFPFKCFQSSIETHVVTVTVTCSTEVIIDTLPRQKTHCSPATPTTT